MTRDYETYMQRARDLLAKGFDTKQARKDALDFVSRAFDFVKKDIHDALLREERTPENDKLYWSVPDCYAWNAKRAALFVAKFPAEVERANACAALRAEIKAAPEVEKKPSARQVQIAVERSHAKTCQICERAILAETGLIAHHGYERPGDGWQTASCFGARALPFEASRDKLGVYVESLKAAWLRHRDEARDLEAETRPARFYWEVKDPRGSHLRPISHHADVTRATFEAFLADHADALAYATRYGRQRPTFESVKAECVADATRKREFFYKEHKRQKARFDGWTQTHSFNAGAWETV